MNWWYIFGMGMIMGIAVITPYWWAKIAEITQRASKMERLYRALVSKHCIRSVRFQTTKATIEFVTPHAMERWWNSLSDERMEA